MSKSKAYFKLFIGAFIQVLLVVVNIVYIANSNLVGMTISSFLLSYNWTLNVTSVKAANRLERVIYAAGAALGTVTGYFLSNVLN